MLPFRSLPYLACSFALAWMGIVPQVSATIATWNGGWPPVAGSYNAGQDANVPITATAQENPPSITLTFHRAGPYTLYRKSPHEDAWGTAIANLPAGSTSYTDTNVTVGVAYEYRANLTGVVVDGEQPSGFLIAGIRVDRTGPRGRVVLVVTDTVSSKLSEELDGYLHDLGAEGWTVHTINVPAASDYSGLGNYHQPIRAQIQALYAAYPGEIKNVILLGKVPVCRSGLGDGLRPDGHDYSYAEACDSYYAEMDADWKDTGSNGKTGDIGNAPGDGKFDSSSLTLWLSGLGIGQKIELGYGRIDTSNYQATEVETLRMYLQKIARYRRSADDFQPGRRGAIRKGFDNVDETGWMSLPSLLGPGNIVAVTSTANLPSDPTARFDPDGLFTRENQNGPFLFYFKGSGYLSARDDDSRAVFLTGMQSHWGWWADATGGGQMASRLGTDNYTLSVIWSIWGTRFFYHRLGLGGDMGDVLRTSINNVTQSGGLHAYATANLGNGDRNGRLWLNHMGDPTLRLFPVRPPRNLTVAASGPGGVALAWANSDDTNLLGVHVYRAATPTGPWIQLTPPGSPATSNSYIDTPPSSGAWTYSVRAIKFETTPCGTFLNASLGATVTVHTGISSIPLTITSNSLSAAAWQTRSNHRLKATGGNLPYTWSLAGGNLPTGMNLSADGVLSGTPLRGGETFHPVFQVKDLCGHTAQIAYELAASTRRVVRLPAEADSMVKSATSYAGWNYGANPSLTVVKSAGIAPLYTDSLAYLRFTLPQLEMGERIEAARLWLLLGGASVTSSTTTLTASLLEDTGDPWEEGSLGGGASTGAALTYTNRPTLLNSRVASVTYLGPLGQNTPVTLDVLPLCLDTLQYDPARKVSALVRSNTTAVLQICSRENPPAARPCLELEITHAPMITLSRPLAGVANLASGHGLVLNASISDTSVLTNKWTVLEGPGEVSFGDPADSSTTAGFSLPGRYTLLLSSDDGTLVSQQMVRIHVLAGGGTVSENLVLHCKLDETSGTTAADSAPDATFHTGTLNSTSGITWSSSGGRFKGALSYTANNRYIQIADHESLDGTNRLSLAMWLNPTAAALDANSRALLSKRSGDNIQEAYSLSMHGGRIRARFNGNNVTIQTINPVLTSGKWTHLAAIYDGTKAGTPDCVAIYVDGVAVPLSGGPETDSAISNTTSALWIGHQSGASNSYSFLGLMDEVRIYRDRALSAADVTDLLLPESCQLAPRLTITPPQQQPASGSVFTLIGSVVDDGLPSSPGAAALAWSKAAGLPGISFTAATSPSTEAVATGSGPLTVRLSADDGAVSTFVESTLVINVSAPKFISWTAQIAWPPEADPTVSGDPDYDGISNLLEYAFGSDPLTTGPANHLPAVAMEGNHLAISFTRNPALAAVTYEVEGSSDLNSATWIPIARAANGGETIEANEGALSITETATGDLRLVKVVDKATIGLGAARFLRVRVTED